MRVFVEIAYDGTGYCGWQTQPNGPTIEEEIGKSIKKEFGQVVPVIGASRTDSGVHAFGNVAVFDIETKMPAHKIAFALNGRLPDDIKIVRSFQVEDEFHPRRCKCCKTYEYKIWNDIFGNPMNRLYTHLVYGAIDIEKMKEATQYIIGTHDFSSFCSKGSRITNRVRTIYSIEITQEKQLIKIQVNGNGFLYNMVRIMVGTLIKVGLEIIKPEDVKTIIESKDRQKAGPTAPAKGLTLIEIDYGDIVS